VKVLLEREVILKNGSGNEVRDFIEARGQACHGKSWLFAPNDTAAGDGQLRVRLSKSKEMLLISKVIYA
jgi:hypothetical protein